MNGWPHTEFNERFQAVLADGNPAANREYLITRADGARIRGVTDSKGMIDLQQGLGLESLTLEILGKAEVGDAG